MGVTFVDVKLVNPARPDKARQCQFLVDSGAVYSVVPAEVLKELGVEPSSTREFLLASGERSSFPVGNAFYEYMGVVGAAPVVFGAKDVFLLGATALEALGLFLDPIRRELKPLPMLLM